MFGYLLCLLNKTTLSLNSSYFNFLSKSIPDNSISLLGFFLSIQIPLLLSIEQCVNINRKKVKLIRLPVPNLSEERRSEMKKMIKSMGEKCKISIRNIRREANDELKNLLKKKEIAEDEEKKFEKNIQSFTDEHIKNIDEKVSSKEKEIMTI